MKTKGLNVSVTKLDSRLEFQGVSSVAMAVAAVAIPVVAFGSSDGDAKNNCGANHDEPCPKPSCGWSF